MVGGMMYVATYDRDFNHLGNVVGLKYSYVQRVYDLDIATFEGRCRFDIRTGFIFQLCDEMGVVTYSGLMKNIVQDGNYVTFKGEDFKKILDTEITLDFSTFWQYGLPQVISATMDAFIEQTVEGETIVEYDYDVTEVSFVDTSWIANYYGEFLKVNVASFLKLYIAYYGLYIRPILDVAEKTITFYFRNNDTEISIRLQDFKHKSTTTGVKTNKTVALIKYNTIEDIEVHQYMPSSQEYYDFQPVGNKSQTNGTIDDPEEYFGSADNYNIGRAMRLDWTEGAGGTTYYLVKAKPRPRPELPEKLYYLGIDNEIYADEIDNADNLRFPIQTKVFESEYLNQAQAMAIRELVNNRFNENIVIDDNAVPIDLGQCELCTMINIYDVGGVLKRMPISEIEIVDGVTSVKLGFKKTLFTEVMK